MTTSAERNTSNNPLISLQMENQIFQDLKGLHLSGMAECWQSLQETRKHQEIALQDGLVMLIQAEHDQRAANKTARLIKKRPLPLRCEYRTGTLRFRKGKGSRTYYAARILRVPTPRSVRAHHRARRCRKKSHLHSTRLPGLSLRLPRSLLQHEQTPGGHTDVTH